LYLIVVARVVFDDGAEDVLVGDAHAHVAERVDACRQQRDLAHHAPLPSNLHNVTDLKAAEDHEHDARGKVLEDTLGGEADSTGV